MPLQRVEHREHVDGVADRAHHHDADAVERDLDHRGEKTPNSSISRTIIGALMSAGDARCSMRHTPAPWGKVRSGWPGAYTPTTRSEEHTSELQSRLHLV